MASTKNYKHLRASKQSAGLFVLPFLPEDGANIQPISASIRSLKGLKKIVILDPTDGGTALNNYKNQLAKEFPNIEIEFKKRPRMFFEAATETGLITSKDILESMGS